MPTNKEETKPVFISSVRNKRRSIAISYTQGEDEFAIECHDNPLPGFYKALEALAPHVCSLCELRGEDAKKIVVLGVTCREKGDNTLATIVVKKKVRKGKRAYPFSTPILPMNEDEENKGADHLESGQAKAISKVIAEAEKYVLGERAQGQIDFAEGDEDESDKSKEKDDAGDKTEPLQFEQPKAVGQS